MNAFEAVRASW